MSDNNSIESNNNSIESNNNSIESNNSGSIDSEVAAIFYNLSMNADRPEADRPEADRPSAPVYRTLDTASKRPRNNTTNYNTNDIDDTDEMNDMNDMNDIYDMDDSSSIASNDSQFLRNTLNELNAEAHLVSVTMTLEHFQQYIQSVRTLINDNNDDNNIINDNTDNISNSIHRMILISMQSLNRSHIIFNIQPNTPLSYMYGYMMAELIALRNILTNSSDTMIIKNKNKRTYNEMKRGFGGTKKKKKHNNKNITRKNLFSQDAISLFTKPTNDDLHKIHKRHDGEKQFMKENERLKKIREANELFSLENDRIKMLRSLQKLKEGNKKFQEENERIRIAREEQDMIDNEYKAGKTKNKTRKNLQFLFNPNDPKKSFDVYIDKNPDDTIPIKYSTVKDVEDTIKKLEKLYKTGKYSHKRIWQVGMILKVRLEAMKKHKNKLYPNAKNLATRFNLSNRYFKFLGNRTKKKTFKERKNLKFKI